MNLNVQLNSLIFSFLFGMFFYFLLDLFNRINYKSKLVFKIIFSFFFVFIITLLYFIILLYVNNGFLHVYFLISVLVGYLFVYFLIGFWFTHRNKK